MNSLLALKKILRKSPIPARWFEADAAPGSIIARDPLVIYTTIAYPDPSAYLRAYAARLRGRNALFIIFMSWIFERGRTTERYQAIIAHA